MKKIVAVLFGLVLCLSMASAKKKDSGKFVLGLDDSFPPLGFRNENNEIVGYDIDLAREVASRMGLELVCQPIDWSAKEMELRSGKIDCIWNGLTLTEKRKAAMACTKPYLVNAQVVVVRAGGSINSLADLSGKKVGVQAGSSAQEAIDGNLEFKKSLKEIVEFKENVTALNDLEMGNLDGVVMDFVVAEYTIAQGKKPLVIISESLAPEEYGIAFSKKNAALRDKVQAVLEEMQADGTVSKISIKWFGSDISTIGK
ncbi:amino acid ABC transporter substrate-binding protein [Treponema sp.]|uniref:amino acid ABC transporter substrate-binding protein n=1 Tax=Treponema sp. TaxID=166 RepID=UPI003EFF95F2